MQGCMFYVYLSLYQCLQECKCGSLFGTMYCSTCFWFARSLSLSALSLSLPVSNKNHVEQTERWIELYCVCVKVQPLDLLTSLQCLSRMKCNSCRNSLPKTKLLPSFIHPDLISILYYIVLKAI